MLLELLLVKLSCSTLQALLVSRLPEVVVTSSYSHPNFLSFYESKLYWLAESKGHTHDIVEQDIQAR